MNTEQKILWASILTFIWTVFYFYIVDRFVKFNIAPLKLLEIKNAVLYGVFGLTSTLMCSVAFFIKPLSELANRKDNTADIILVFLLSYFLFHLPYYLRHQSLCHNFQIWHHSCSIVLYILYLFFQRKERYWVLLVFFLGQASNFINAIKNAIKNLNKKYTQLYELSQSLFFCIFLVARSIIQVVNIKAILSPNVSLLAKIIFAQLMLFSGQMCKKMIAVIIKKKEREAEMKIKSIQFQWFHQDPSQLRQLSFYCEY